MSKTLIYIIVSFLLLELSQALIFSRICIFNVAIPYVFVYFILKLPMSMRRENIILLSFFAGLFVDIFTDTLGMNALSCTLMSVLRKPIFSLYFPREDEMDSPTPSIKSIGVSAFVKYAFTFCMIYSIFISFIQIFIFNHLFLLIIRAVCSGFLTFLIIWGIETLMNSRSAKRL